MIWPWIMVYVAVDFGVGISCPFCAELPYCPVCFVFVVKELHKSVGGIPIGALGIGRGGARCGDNCTR